MKLIAGVDEAGRGALAGPVVAAAVILPDEYDLVGLNDSKKVSPLKREKLFGEITNQAISIGVGIVSHIEIDKINILNASILAMHKSIIKLNHKVDFIIVDGNKFNSHNKIPFKCIIKGDSKYMSIAAASILAKTSRDDLMFKLSKSNPVYGWGQNKGYPTKAHKEAIRKHGISVHHRKSFKLI